MSKPSPVSLSVVIPVHDGAATLPHALHALALSDLPRDAWELIVVDDGSRDDSGVIAAAHADTVVRLPGAPRGPAYARNRGAEIAAGEVVLFLDADVRVPRDTLRQIVTTFGSQPDVAALSGVYDESVSADGIVSRYRNAWRHHQQTRRGAPPRFWAGCGAVRREVFRRAGMFDEWRFARPQVEDLELTRRLAACGGRVCTDARLAVVHLKRWTLTSLLRTELRDRAVPWMRLGLSLSEEGGRPWDAAELFAIASVVLGAAIGTVGMVVQSMYAMLLAGCLLVLALSAQLRFYAGVARRREPLLVLAAIPLHLMHHAANAIAIAAGWTAYHLVGEARPRPTVEAYSEMGVETWPPVPARARTEQV